MHYSMGVEQALHILLFFMDKPGKNIGVQELAKPFRLSPTYLSKLLTKLTKAGILRSVPGASGGYRLAKEPGDITFLDVVESIEGRESLFQCANIRFNPYLEMGGDLSDLPPEMVRRPCLIQSVFMEAEQQLRKTLAAKTVADVHRELQTSFPDVFAGN